MNNPDKVKVKDKIYKLNTDYKIALRIQDLLTDPLISDIEKSYGYIYLLYGDDGINDKENWNELAEKGFKFLNLGQPRKESNEEPTMDLLQDLNYIKASFMSDYHIDLDKEEMHWWTFMNLLNGLTDNCILSKVRMIRQEDLSEHKGKDREKWIKLKEQVALTHRKTKRELELDEFWEKEVKV